MAARSEVTSDRWPKRLIDFFHRCVPPEARSAVIVRAMSREIAMAANQWLGEVAITADMVEAYARGWLDGVLYAAAEDPRRDTVEVPELPGLVSCRSELGIPIRVGNHELVRRARGVGPWKSITGSGHISYRCPVGIRERIRREIQVPRSRFSANAVKRELMLLNVTSPMVVETPSTSYAFALGLSDGISHGAALRPSATLDPAHVEDLVDREITAYLCEHWTEAGR